MDNAEKRIEYLEKYILLCELYTKSFNGFADGSIDRKLMELNEEYKELVSSSDLKKSMPGTKLWEHISWIESDPSCISF